MTSTNEELLQAETLDRESCPAELPLSSGFRRGLAWITAVGSAIVLLDLMVFRPLCPPARGQTGCFSIGGDAAGVFVMARLMAWGNGLASPIAYEPVSYTHLFGDPTWVEPDIAR